MKSIISRRSFIKMTTGALAAMSSPWAFRRQAYGAEEIRLGGISSLSGVASPIGHELANGLQLAVETINREGGVLGRPVKLFLEDDESKKDSGLSKARKLVERDRVHFLAGVVDSSICMAIQHYGKEKKTIFVNTGSGNDVLTEPPNCSRYFFKIQPNTRMGSLAVQYPEKSFGNNWVFMAIDTVWGKLVVKYSKLVLEKNKKVNIRQEIYVPFSETNYASYLTPLVSNQPDVIMIVVFGSHYPRMIKQIRQIGIKSHIHSYYYERPSVVAAGDDALGLSTFALYFTKNPKVPKAHTFANEFNKKFKEVPGGQGATAYAGVEMLLEAVKNAGTVEADPVIKALETSQFKNTVLAPKVYFRRSDHQAIVPVFVGKIVKDPELQYEFQLEYTIDDPTELLTPEDKTGCPVQ